ncbi:MAG: hypothetical protein ACLSVD_13585 [Eggerthellaceae bacterium]
MLFVFWLPVAFSCRGRARPRGRFGTTRNRLVRDRLPFGVLELLAFDTLPRSPPRPCSRAGVCDDSHQRRFLSRACGAGRRRIALLQPRCRASVPGRPRLCYEYGALALVGVGFALSLFASAAVAAMGMALFAAAVALVVRFGSECVR